MKRVHLEATWPDSWKSSYRYDQEEVFGPISQRGYAFAYENRRRITLQLLTEVLPKGARVLDIAGAQGNFSLGLAELGYDVTWNDLRGELTGYVQLKYESGNLTFAPGNVFELRFPHLFDGVLITEIIEHVAHPDDFLDQAASFVRPGGYLVLTTPNGAYFRNTLPKFSECADPSFYEAAQFRPDADGHIFLLHPEEIATLAARADLRIERQFLFTNPLTGGHMKMEALLRVLPKGMVDGLEEMTQNMPSCIRKKILVQMAARFVKNKGTSLTLASA